MRRAIVALCAALTLAACGAESRWADDQQVAQARHVAGPPTTLTLYTSINDRNGSGAHSALLINASQRVLFDPAGSWDHVTAPERNDVRFGMSDRMVHFYEDYHARDSADEKFHLVKQTITVSPQVAETVMQRAMNYGAVPKAHCANSISTILSGVPELGSFSTTYYPKKLRDQFARLPGVREEIITEENDNPAPGHGVVLVDDKGNRVN